jgi:hypothetical protein
VNDVCRRGEKSSEDISSTNQYIMIFLHLHIPIDTSNTLPMQSDTYPKCCSPTSILIQPHRWFSCDLLHAARNALSPSINDSSLPVIQRWPHQIRHRMHAPLVTIHIAHRIHIGCTIVVGDRRHVRRQLWHREPRRQLRLCWTNRVETRQSTWPCLLRLR